MKLKKKKIKIVVKKSKFLFDYLQLPHLPKTLYYSDEHPNF